MGTARWVLGDIGASNLMLICRLGSIRMRVSEFSPTVLGAPRLPFGCWLRDFVQPEIRMSRLAKWKVAGKKDYDWNWHESNQVWLELVPSGTGI